MADNEAPIIYRFLPREPGEFLRDVPARDLTLADLANMTGAQMRDAFAPHPLHGTPLYVAVEGAAVADFSQVHEQPLIVVVNDEPVEVTPTPPPAPLTAVQTMVGDEQPKWFQAKVEQGLADGVPVAAMLPDETQKAYEARVAAEQDGNA